MKVRRNEKRPGVLKMNCYVDNVGPEARWIGAIAVMKLIANIT